MTTAPAKSPSHHVSQTDAAPPASAYPANTKLLTPSVDGPGHLWLESSKGVMVAMMIHELATNAVKHGALSNGSGRVSITWVQTSEPNLVKLTWQEIGGPEVRPPKAKGFGSHLIERAFGGQLGAAQLVFDPTGLTCTLEIVL